MIERLFNSFNDRPHSFSIITIKVFMVMALFFTPLFLHAQVGITGAIMINRNRPVTNSAEKEVFVNLMARGATHMMLSNNGSFIGAKWIPFSPTVSHWRLTGEDGRKTVYAQFKDGAGNISEIVSAEIELDRTPPLDPSVVIDDGMEYTNRKDRLVRLDFDVVDGFQMRVSNRFDFLGAPWISFRRRITKWMLTPRTGEKTIYVQYRDRAGNLSEIATSKIVLDYIPPTQVGIDIENGAVYTKNRLVTIAVSAKDATHMTFKGGPGWEDYKETYTLELSEGDGEKEINAKFKDSGGNISVVVQDKIILDTKPPTDCIVNINNQDKYARDPRNLTVEFFASGADEMLVSNNANFNGAAWQGFARVLNSWAVGLDNGVKTIYVKFRDKAGNESEVISDDIILDNSVPVVKNFKIAKEGSVFDPLRKMLVTKDASHNVDLKIQAEDADYMLISNSNSFYGAEWKRYKEEYKNWALEGENDGERYVFIKFRDKAGNISDPVSDRIIVDTQAPVDCKIFAKSGPPEYENIYCIDVAKKVDLRLFARGADFVKVSNEPDFKDAKWMPYNTQTFWTLSNPDGNKTVYAKFKDLVGNESVSVSDSIILDRKPPYDYSIILNKGEEATNNYDQVVLVQVKAKDAVSMQLSNVSDFRNARWVGYSDLNFDWRLAGDDGIKTVYVRFRDIAGNVSGAAADSILLDRRPPYAGTVVINDGERITNNSNKNVNLKLKAEDATEMRISNDFRFTDSEWEAYNEARDWTLYGPDGIKNVFVQFRDKLGNVSRTAQARIGIDRQAPEQGALLIDRGAKFCTNTNKKVNLFIRVRDAAQMMISNEELFKNKDWQKVEPYVQDWVLDGDDGEKKVFVKFQDKAGNQTEPITATITLDRQQPVSESMVIDDGARYTNQISQKVNLKLNAEGASEMMIAHDGFFRAPAKWEPYKKEATWVLRGGQGKKTVVVRFRDEAGNVSGNVEKEIILDTDAPVPRGFTINDKKSSTSDRVVTLFINALGNPSHMMISEDPKFGGVDWEPYQVEKTITLSASPGSKRLFIKYKDEAGNESAAVFADIILLGTE